MSFDRMMEPTLPVGGNPNLRPLEIEIIDEEANVIPDGDGVIVDFDPLELLKEQIPHGANLAEYMDEQDLQTVSSELISDFEQDLLSRESWEKTYMEGIDLLGLKFEERSQPWDGACGVFHPMLAESVVRFQSQTIQEVFPASGPAKARIEGSKSNEKTRQAHRVAGYLNYSATQIMKEYRVETEKLLFSLPLAGSAFRKVYFDPAKNRETAMFVPAEDFVVNYGTTDLESCERATHVMKRTANQVRKLQVSGFYLDVELPEPTPDLSKIERKHMEIKGEGEIDTDDRHTLLEMMVDYDLPGFEDPNGVAKPYIITIDKSSGTILSIRRNWREDSGEKRLHYVHYQYLPGLGFYGFGLVHIIGGLSKSATSLIRQLIDAGTLANLPGGLKTRGLRIKGDDSPISPGEWRDADVLSGSLKDNLFPMPYKEPSTVLYQLLGDVVKEGRRFASAADVKAADMNAEAPVGTTLAILEREMKILSAVQARIHHAMGQELQMLAEVIHDFGPDQYPYDLDGEFSLKEDFDARVDIVPVSDPNAGTMAQRIMQYQAALQLSATNPQIYDMPTLHRQMLEVLGVQEAEKIIPTEEDMVPTDPVTENMSILNGKPVKAHQYQDHEAHIQVHMAMAENPEIVKLMEKNPKAKAIMAAAADHVTEHVAMAYRQKIEQELGVHLPGADEPLPEDVELRISRLVVPAAAQLTGKAQRMAQAEENAKMQEDPIVKMKMEELRQKGEKLAKDARVAERKQQMAEAKAMDEAKFKREKMESDERREAARIMAQLQDSVRKAETEADRIDAQGRLEAFKIGFETVRDAIDEDVKEDSNGRQGTRGE
jgi:hypothetical protein